MAIYEIFSHPELRRYKTSVFSKASLLMLIILALTFIPPLLIVYRSYGFWLREATYREQPSVAFKKELILILNLQNENTIAYSTFQRYNQLLDPQSKRIPLIKSREDDINGDGLYDRLNLDIEMPMNSRENVIGVQLMLFFYYKLRRFSLFHMESLAFVEYTSSFSASSFDVIGDLGLRQKQLLAHKGLDTRYNGSLVDASSLNAETYSIPNILRKYSERNVTTVLQDDYKIWSQGTTGNGPFMVSARINYPEQLVYYTPGFWYLIKWGWIQYVSVLLIFLYILNRVKIFVFQHQVVTTVVESIAPKDKFS